MYAISEQTALEAVGLDAMSSMGTNLRSRIPKAEEVVLKTIQ
jgi:hypothetical protein